MNNTEVADRVAQVRRLEDERDIALRQAVDVAAKLARLRRFAQSLVDDDRSAEEYDLGGEILSILNE